MDNDNLAGIFVDPKYKSLMKLMDNLVIDLQNRMFMHAERFEEFLAIKWARAALQLIPRTIKERYESITRKHEESKMSESATSHQDFEDIPDGIIESSTPNT